ncbi:hypothetical protein HanRHA438_Chr06g0278371 [Helianthus annuus]|uniref:Titan9 n=1 Tax=Helianthus annuus TaxID=4232 RepID=A0A9K3IUT8_HELAN|nr:hypothetical protein HanXRQr2_Chr06g0269131 [Helianthus annuus]KAJ0574292.1 hypothetical protein HanHA89_Chr06g0236511 [Helianthus annuus]KAJ0738628.1 hypothetical protein HanLR1_Chr06g0220451 [Helianthus annuus]KAJ0741510.1 hypothetical protein HanOQP8_Chr06g0228891 [Helianthus annuus]KAJ0912798.1 hypothetical protein HanRHA438_Chr06g0278371 [Helianthus annuus]
MEALYSKLYDKYTKLKVKKASEIEQLSLDQEEKFKTYVSAADELIGYLTNEKDMLHAQLGELRQEIASIRSAKDEEQQQYEKMLLEANEKNKQLSEEIERLQRKELDSSDIRSPRSPLSNSNSTKRKRITIHENENEVVDKDNLISGVFYNDATQAKCCRPRLGGTGDAASSNCCMFQELVECLVDLKFSVGTSSDDTIQITAVHESSADIIHSSRSSVPVIHRRSSAACIHRQSSTAAPPRLHPRRSSTTPASTVSHPPPLIHRQSSAAI